MKNVFLFIICLFSIACVKKLNEDVSKNYLLLERKEQLKNGKEWENMHNMYTRLIQQIRQKPENAKPYIELAELFMVEARVTGEHGHYFPLALELVDKGKTLAEKNEDLQFRALSDKASIQLSLHQFANAKQTASEAIKFNPYNAQIYGALVDAHVELGEYENAVQYADKMVSIRPDLRSYSRVSYLREIYGDMDGAIEAMIQAVESGYPGYEETAWTRLQLGDLYMKTNKLDKAEVHYKTILEERPNYAFAIAALANIQIQKGKTDEAMQLLDQSIAILPEVSFYITKAELLKKQGKQDAARALAASILEMLADDEKAGHNMDITYAEVYDGLLDNPEKSLHYAMKEYNQRPQNLEVNKYLAAYFQKMGNKEKEEFHSARSIVSKKES